MIGDLAQAHVKVLQNRSRQRHGHMVRAGRCRRSRAGVNLAAVDRVRQPSACRPSSSCGPPGSFLTYVAAVHVEVTSGSSSAREVDDDYSSGSPTFSPMDWVAPRIVGVARARVYSGRRSGAPQHVV